MDVSRRGFLKLFGVGVGAAAVTVAAPKVAVSLFGASGEPLSKALLAASPIIVPGTKTGLGRHWVVYPRKSFQAAKNIKHVPGMAYVRDESATTRWSGGRMYVEGTHQAPEGVVGRIQSTTPDKMTSYGRWDTTLRQRADWHVSHWNDIYDNGNGRKLNMNDLVVDPEWTPGMDPHAAFYKASLKLRQKVADYSNMVLEQIPGYAKEHGGFHLVTVVHNDIYARPKGTMTPHLYDEGQFEVACDFDTFATPTPPSDIAEFEAYSEFGEFPIEIPTDIEMGILLKLDKQIVAQPDLVNRRGFFANWRS